MKTMRFAMCAFLAAILILGSVSPTFASSHREAPLISEDPTADNTDLYVFRSPDRPDTVTIIANFLPFENPANGPLFYKFSDSALYEIHIFNNKGDHFIYRFDFRTAIRDNRTFRYNNENGRIDSLTDKAFNIRQFYNVTRVENDHAEVIGRDVPSPPVNIGPKSTPNYESLARQAVALVTDDIRVFAGQRDDPYFANDGAFFDLLNSPISPPGSGRIGIDSYAGLNVQTIAIQIPISKLVRTPNGTVPQNPSDPNAVIAVYANASRQRTRELIPFDGDEVSDDFVQISRIGHPLINALIIDLKNKDPWNRSNPLNDGQFNDFYRSSLPANYIKTFLGVNVPANPRTDLTKILLEGFSLNQVGVNFSNKGGPNRQADLLRLNVAVPPRRAGDPGFNRLGLFRGDLAGYPNGRRLEDDVMDISMQIYAGATPFSSDLNLFPNNALGDGVNGNDVPFLNSFPYIATPHPGFRGP